MIFSLTFILLFLILFFIRKLRHSRKFQHASNFHNTKRQLKTIKYSIIFTIVYIIIILPLAWKYSF